LAEEDAEDRSKGQRDKRRNLKRPRDDEEKN
jgi:hypothetical protein